MHEAITMSDAAAERIRALLGAGPDVPATAGLRIDVVAGGCSGHQYRLALDEATEDDLVTEVAGVRVLVAGDAMRYVRGARLEYDEGAGGFRVDNPNVVYGCGCGSSFVLRDEQAEPAVR